MSTAQETISLENLKSFELDWPSSEDTMDVTKYLKVKQILDSDSPFNEQILNRLLKTCTLDLKPGVEHLPIVLSTVTAILKKVNQDMTIDSLIPSAEEIIKTLNDIAPLDSIGTLKIISLKTMCFDTLLAYPEHVLKVIGSIKLQEVLDLIDMYCSNEMASECRNMAFQLLTKLLKALPPDTKMKLVQAGVNIWFQKVLPTVVLTLSTDSDNSEQLMEALELLTETLVELDYADNKEWHNILESIYNTEKYPTILKTMLENKNVLWHRLWITLTKLLKDQITKVTQKKLVGSPINAMLPIVESALKMKDDDSRILAFKCWMALIDNFKTDTNEASVTRRMKLLLIPLKSQNAKSEQTAEAKINAWWYLIQSFHGFIGTLANQVLLPFINICFGHPEKSLLVPGLFSVNLKAKCIEMLVEIFGHVECPGCVTVSPLKNNLITAKILKSYWSEWRYALKLAFKFLITKESDKATQQLRCLWKSTLLTLSKLSDNDDRSNKLYNLLEDFIFVMEVHTKSEELADNFYQAIILPLFNADHSVRTLLKTNTFEVNNSVTQILDYLLDNKQVLKTKSVPDLQLITDVILDKKVCDPNKLIEWFNTNMFTNENSAVVWCALAETICKSRVELHEHVLCQMMNWPVTHMAALETLRTENFYTYWKALFDSSQNLNKTEFQSVIDFIPIVPVNTVSGLNFRLCVVLSLLDHFLDTKYEKGCDSSIFALYKLLKNTITVYEQLAALFPMMVQTFAKIISSLTQDINTNRAEKFLDTLQLVLKLTKDDGAASSHVKCRILIPLNEMLKISQYVNLLHIIVDDLANYLSLNKQDEFRKYVIDVLNTILSKSQGDARLESQVKAAIMKHDEIRQVVTNSTAKEAKTGSPKVEFTKILPILTPTRRVETPDVSQNGAPESKLVPTTGSQKPGVTPIITTGRLSKDVILSLSPEITLTKVPKYTPKIETVTSPQTKIIETNRSGQAGIIEHSNKRNNETTAKFTPAEERKYTPRNKNMDLPKVTHIEILKDPVAIQDELNTMIVESESPVPNTTVVENASPVPKSPLVTKNELPAPKSTEFKKKAQKKEPTIVNTVVENGEEYSVVKSHWKFNPRKLTENQKEKFKRKREDIPALYQDLSQSQDEVKLGTWKTDSQDNSTTASKSNSNSTSSKDFTSILQCMNSTNVIPKIMENVLSDKSINEQDKDKNSNDMPIKSSVTPSPKTPRTLRGPLKDRVFRNVKNLMEKSGLRDNTKLSNEILVDEKSGLRDNTKLSTEILVDEDLKTPPTKIKIVEEKISTNSAPPKINIDRPTRLIKKPKKFEDSELICLKRRRRLASDSSDNSLHMRSKDTSPTQAVTDIAVTEPTKIVTTLANDSEKSTSKPFTEIKKAINKTMSSADIVLSNNSEVPNPAEEDKTQEKSSKPIIGTPKNRIRSRIEKQLVIDMVEGHPFLSTETRQQRSAKKYLSVRRKSLTTQKSNRQDTTDVGTTSFESQKRRRGRPSKIKPLFYNKSHKTASVTVVDSQGTQEKLPASIALSQTTKISPNNKSPASVTLRPNSPTSSISSREKSSPSTKSSQDYAFSEDIIESSQDSSITTISTKSSKSVKSVPSVKMAIGDRIKKMQHSPTQDLIDQVNNDFIPLSDSIIGKTNEDIELSVNKSLPQCKSVYDLTENMDTEPFDEQKLSGSSDCIIINDINTPIAISTEHSIGPETQEIAEADTEPFGIECVTHAQIHTDSSNNHNNLKENDEKLENKIEDEITQSLFDENSNNGEEAVSSPFKDDTKKKKEFLNDTLEISPIKTLSPVRHKKSPSPETSTDYVLIELTSPVHSNGEPFNDKCDSPEIFTEDKISPEKRDQSPPREKIKTINTSPSSSLSLKKNRTKVGRGSGRAAQIMGLCAPGKLNAIIDAGKSVNEEPKKNSTVNSQARRNLRILNIQNSVDASSEEPTDDPHINDSDSDENFLKFKKMLPTADCSPSGPILKRKLDEIPDYTPGSSASKRKRVSFHDPPVSTTIAVQKYIEPLGRSPQNSEIKRQERQARGFVPLKSPKRLDHIFKLDTVLTKAIEGFTNETPLTSNDSEMSSIEQTPAVEVVKTSDLNNTDPICPDLIDCVDPIGNIASELSSPAMKDLLIKELIGKVDTVADLAKMTELEVNRLCIKAPKVEVAKQVLTSYAAMRNFSLNETRFDATVASNKSIDMDVQTDITSTCDSEVQTMRPPVTCKSVQTHVGRTLDMASQTIESGTKTTEDIITSCLAGRPDFLEQLGKQLTESDVSLIAADKLTFDASLEVLMKKTNETNQDAIIHRLVKDKGTVCSANTLSQFTEYLCKRFQSDDLILLCSKVLHNVHANVKK